MKDSIAIVIFGLKDPEQEIPLVYTRFSNTKHYIHFLLGNLIQNTT